MKDPDGHLPAYPLTPHHDLSTESLLVLAKEEIVSGAEQCRALVALHDRPTDRVFDAAESLTQSPDADSRELGVRIFRELGTYVPAPESFKSRAAVILVDLLSTESDPTVLGWTISAIGWNQLSEALSAVLAFQRHPDRFVRFHVAAAMIFLLDVDNIDPRGLTALRELSRDEDAEVRYYALTTLLDDLNLPPSEVADVLRDLRDDPDEQIREIANRYPM